MRTIELTYNCRTARGHRFQKDVIRAWPKDASVRDVMQELTTELQSLGCEDVWVVKTSQV